MWSSWASGAHAVSIAGKEGACIGKGGTTLQEEGSRKKSLLFAAARPPVSGAGVWRRDSVEQGGLDLGVVSLPSSALEIASVRGRGLSQRVKGSYTSIRTNIQSSTSM